MTRVVVAGPPNNCCAFFDKASKVPTATTFTLMPVFSVNRGNKKPKSPDCSVDVVDATMIERSCAKATPWVISVRTAKNEIHRCFISVFFWRRRESNEHRD